jgi:glutathione S-transferase
MLTLHDNPLSPSARKVRMALRHKEVAFASIDALALDQRERPLGSVCGAPSVADLALFPHVSSPKRLGVRLDAFPGVLRWSRDMRRLPVVRADLEHVRRDGR